MSVYQTAFNNKITGKIHRGNREIEVEYFLQRVVGTDDYDVIIIVDGKKIAMSLEDFTSIAASIMAISKDALKESTNGEGKMKVEDLKKIRIMRDKVIFYDKHGNTKTRKRATDWVLLTNFMTIDGMPVVISVGLDDMEIELDGDEKKNPGATYKVEREKDGGYHLRINLGGEEADRDEGKGISKKL